MGKTYCKIAERIVIIGLLDLRKILAKGRNDKMQILIIRHGDPDYSIDSLTEKGWREAELLAERLSKLDIKAFYVSPLGRAKDTASLTLKKMNREATELPWMQEFFGADIARPDADGRTIAWDWLPQDWTKEKNYYDKEKWADSPIMQDSTVLKEYQWVAGGLDKLLSHLLGISPMVMWHGFCAAPTSVTTINTEERRKGIASFRVSSFGDTSHLYAAGEPASFHARFCEFYGKEGERTD